MTMSESVSRQSFAEQPYTFMTNNVVRINITPSSVQAADANAHTGILIRNGDQFLTRVTVRKQANTTVQGANGSVFVLELADTSIPKDEKRRAYFVPYFVDTTCGATLGSGARYMFTPTMDGCSFGVGAQNGNSSVLVMHSNSATSAASYGPMNAGALNQQEKVQRILLNSAFLANNDALTSSIAPSQYMTLNGGIPLGTDKVRSTTFGRLSNGTWRFYTLRYRFLGGGVYSHEGVHNA
jgi:hypothetical protein